MLQTVEHRGIVSCREWPARQRRLVAFVAQADPMSGLPCTWRPTPRTGQILGGTVQLETVLGGPSEDTV